MKLLGQLHHRLKIYRRGELAGQARLGLIRDDSVVEPRPEPGRGSRFWSRLLSYYWYCGTFPNCQDAATSRGPSEGPLRTQPTKEPTLRWVQQPTRWGSRIASRVWAGLVRGGRLQRSVGGEGSAWNTWNTTGLGAGAGPGQARRWLGAGTALRPVGSPQGGPFRTAFPRAVPPGSGCASCKGLARPARTGRQRKRFCRGTRR